MPASRQPLSVAIITLNAATQLEECLKSAHFADEIVVVLRFKIGAGGRCVFGRVGQPFEFHLLPFLLPVPPAGLTDIAGKYQCAVVLVGHMNKSSGGKDLYRGLGSIDIAQKKAITARYFNMSTADLGAAAQPGKELFGIEVTNRGLVIFGGGELLIRNGVIVGAIGVSGGSVAEDTAVSKAGAAALK